MALSLKISDTYETVARRLKEHEDNFRLELEVSVLRLQEQEKMFSCMMAHYPPVHSLLFRRHSMQLKENLVIRSTGKERRPRAIHPVKKEAAARRDSRRTTVHMILMPK